MADTTKDKLVKAIESLTDKIGSETGSGDALKYTQSTLNLAHTIQVLEQCKK